MTQAPTTYAAWVALLDAYAVEGNEATLAAMEAGRIEWTSGLAERISAQADDALRRRLRALTSALGRDVEIGRGRVDALEQALVLARKRLGQLSRFSNMTSLPLSLRNHLDAELERAAQSLQETLERNARAGRDTNEDALRVILRNKLSPTIRAVAPPDSEPRTGPRKIIL